MFFNSSLDAHRASQPRNDATFNSKFGQHPVTILSPHQFTSEDTQQAISLLSSSRATPHDSQLTATAINDQSRERGVVQVDGLPFNITLMEVLQLFWGSNATVDNTIIVKDHKGKQATAFIDLRLHGNIDHVVSRWNGTVMTTQAGVSSLNLHKVTAREWDMQKSVAHAKTCDKHTAVRDGVILKVLGLPSTTTRSDLHLFFHDINVKPNGISMELSPSSVDGTRNTKIAYIEVSTLDDAMKAIQKQNRTFKDKGPCLAIELVSKPANNIKGDQSLSATTTDTAVNGRSSAMSAGFDTPLPSPTTPSIPSTQGTHHHAHLPYRHHQQQWHAQHQGTMMQHWNTVAAAMVSGHGAVQPSTPCHTTMPFHAPPFLPPSGFGGINGLNIPLMHHQHLHQPPHHPFFNPLHALPFPMLPLSPPPPPPPQQQQGPFPSSIPRYMVQDLSTGQIVFLDDRFTMAVPPASFHDAANNDHHHQHHRTADAAVHEHLVHGQNRASSSDDNSSATRDERDSCIPITTCGSDPGAGSNQGEAQGLADNDDDGARAATMQRHGHRQHHKRISEELLGNGRPSKQKHV